MILKAHNKDESDSLPFDLPGLWLSLFNTPETHTFNKCMPGQ